jgi:hypothetical protein
MAVRLVVAVLLLVLLGGGLWWTASLAPDGDGISSEWTGTVYVVGLQTDGEGGRGGSDVLSGDVRARGTPLDAVEALGAELGFGVDVEQQTWIGRGCTAAYVVGIAGQRETTTGGWNYYTREPGGDWTWRSEGAGCYGLAPGEQVEWCWVEVDVCGRHAA